MIMQKRINLLKTNSKKTLHVIPFFFTFANALLGLLSVVKAIDDQFIVAVYCILLAAFMDTLDGRLARAFDSTSGLGTELDSLCDAISFCIAPVILLYSWGVQDFGIIGLAVLGLYLCAGLFRLARFNVIQQDGSQPSSSFFLGLPTPMAAFFLLSFVLYRDWFEYCSVYFLFERGFFSLIILFVALLMVSTIPFPSFKKYKGLKRSSSTLWFIVGALLLILCLVFHYPIMFIVPFLYIMSVLLFQTYLRIRNFLIGIQYKKR